MHTGKIDIFIENRSEEPLLLNKNKRGKETKWHNIYIFPDDEQYLLKHVLIV